MKQSTLTLTERKRNNKRAERLRKAKILKDEGFNSSERVISVLLSMEIGKRNLIFAMLRDQLSAV